MRRFILLIGVAAILAGIKASGSLMIFEQYYPDAQYIFFLGDSEISVEIKDANNTRKNIRGIKGEAVRFDGGEYEIDSIVDYLNGVIIREETVGNIIIVYGYSPRLGNAVTLSNDRINFQIAVSCGVVTIGSPLIAGSY